MRQGKTDIQIRGVPVATRDRLRARAKAQGRSMSEYVLSLIENDLRLMSMDEWYEWQKARKPAKLRLPKGKTVADLVREAKREAGFIE